MATAATPQWEQLSPSARQAIGFSAGHSRLRRDAERGHPGDDVSPLVADLDLLFGSAQVHGRRTQWQTLFGHFGASWESFEARTSPVEAQQIPEEPLEGFPELDSSAQEVLVRAAELARDRNDGADRPVRVRHLVGALLHHDPTAEPVRKGLAGRLGADDFDRLVRIYVDDYLAVPDADLATVLYQHWPPVAGGRTFEESTKVMSEEATSLDDQSTATRQRGVPTELPEGATTAPGIGVGRIWIVYVDGTAEDELAVLDAAEPTTWSANEHARKGDLLLVYATAPVSALAYVLVAESDAFEPADDAWPWDHAIDVSPLGTLSSPVDLNLIRTHPRLSGWRFARSQQGALRWTDDIRSQRFWEPLRALMVATNPHLVGPLAAWEGVPDPDLLAAARPAAAEIPDAELRATVLAGLDAATASVTTSATIEAREPDYQAEPRVARDYWTVDDQLGTRPYADAVAAFIRHQDTKPPLTIGIKAPWGAGKTSLMRMIQANLDPPKDSSASTWEFPDLRLTDEGLRALEGDVASGAPSDETERGPVTVWRALQRTHDAPHEAPRLDTVKASEVERAEPDEWRATVWFNPWMYQTGEEVWAGFAHDIIDQVTGRLRRADRERFWLELNVRRIDRQAVRRKIYSVVLEKLLPAAVVFVVGVVATVAASLFSIDSAKWVGLLGTGVWLAVAAWRAVAALTQNAADSVGQLVQPPDLGGLGEMIGGALEGVADEVLPDPAYASKTGFLHLVQTDIRHVLDLVADARHPLVVFVDDLDRCSPGVVAQTIEAINLFLAGEFPNVVFVLAVEPAVVAAHVDVAYGALVERLRSDPLQSNSDRLGWRFLEKIVQLPLNLPRPSRRQVEEYLASLFTPDEEEARDVLSSEEERRIEALVKETVERVSAGTLEDLPDRLDEVEMSLREPESSTPDPVASEARRRVVAEVFERFFNDADPLVREIVHTEAMRLPTRNAREVKRLLNLFRFYSFVAVRNRLLDQASRASQRETLQMVARLAVLAIRWPYLLDPLSRAGSEEPEEDDQRPPIRLEDLERSAGGDDEGWIEALREAGLAHEEGDPPALLVPTYAGDLREFCRTQPPIGRFARDFL